MRCQRVEKSCFACLPEGECNALEDTDFCGKPCPFYKMTEHDYRTQLVFEDLRGKWKRVRGFGNKYFVSDRGEVINNLKKPMRVYYSEHGMPYVQLYLWGSQLRLYLAAVVADAWVAGRGRLDFKDGDITNCRADNIIRR